MSITEILVVAGSILAVLAGSFWNLSIMLRGLTFRDCLEELGFVKPKNINQ